MKIKICGLKSIRDIEYINEAGVDFAGFIFAEKSKRKIDYTIAKEMKKELNPDIKSVGVFVDEDTDKVVNYADIIDIFQLHGKENNDYIKELKKRTGKEIIKAFGPDENLRSNIAETDADYILIDSRTETAFGGTGQTFDLKLIPKTDKKIFLAGGLNSKNVENAIRTVKPYCLDINSGVETDGNKDENKIKEIVKIIRNLEKN